MSDLSVVSQEAARLLEAIDRAKSGVEWRDEMARTVASSALQSNAERLLRHLLAHVAEVEGQLKAVREALTCRNGHAHYCPNCDNTIAIPSGALREGERRETED